MIVGTYIMLFVQLHQPERKPWKSPKTSFAHRYTPPSPGKRCASSITAIPCGQKKSSNEISHNHTVTPPLAAMEGTTFRLKTATTKRRTRSQRPKTRRKCGAPVSRALTSGTLTSVDIISPAFDSGALSRQRACGSLAGQNHSQILVNARRRLRRRHRALAVLEPAPAQFLQTPQGACRCPLPCVAPRWSTARPTSKAARARRDLPSQTSNGATDRHQWPSSPGSCEFPAGTASTRHLLRR